MRTAILISGELRTFALCRKTMTFLDHPNVDIYVSTWDRTIVKNDRINLFINDEVSEEEIQQILGKPATIMVEPTECFQEKKYNSKMIHRWLAGMQMILDSGKDYDYVLVTRPDLFFNHTHPCMFDIDSLILDGDKQFAWYEEGHKLQDNLFFAKFETMKELFARLSIQDWQNAKEQDWHTWWTDFVGWTEVKRLGGHAPFTFCRPIVSDGMDFRDVYRCYIDWRDMQIMTQVEIGNRAAVVKDWGEAEVSQAESKSFFRYFNAREDLSDTAILIAGEFRSFAKCRHTMNFLNYKCVNVFVSTWDYDSTTESAISESTVVSVLKRPAHIVISPTLTRNNEKYNCNYIRLITTGLAAIEDSNTNPSKILIVRPDIFFNVNNIAEHLTEPVSPKSVKVGWFNPKHCSLSEQLILSTLNDLKFIFCLKSWATSANQDWHRWLYDRAINNGCIIGGLTADYQFVRPNFTGGGWKRVCDTATAWKKQQLKKHPRKMAILVCGMTRSMSIASASWGPLKSFDAHWFLSTWDKTSESFSDDLVDSLMTPELTNMFNKMCISAYDNIQVNSYIKRCGSNAIRYLYLLSVFRQELEQFDRIIILRPDTFVDIPDIESFTEECIFTDDNLSNVVSQDFVQDFMIVVNSDFFRYVGALYEKARKQGEFNPHIEFPLFAREYLGKDFVEAISFRATLVRPNHTTSMLDFDTVHNHWIRWQKLNQS